jgi:hypothetical protein
MLYALSSTGNISMGNRRPYDCDTDTDWIVRLWESLACDIRAAMRAIRKINSAQDDDDLATFERFEKFAEGIADSFVA